MRNANVNITLDRRREKSDHTFPIILRLSYQERNTSIPTGVCVALKDWDEKEKMVKRTYRGTESHVRLNNFIHKLKVKALDTILKLQESGQLSSLSVAALRNRITKNDRHNSFYRYAEQHIQDLFQSHRIGTARCYKGVLSVLQTYTKGRDLKFTDINYSFLSGFELQHRSKGLGLNGLSVYLRAVRAIYNKAIKEGIAEKQLYPFYDYKIKSAPTLSRAIEWTSLEKIIKLQLETSHKLFHARNFFLASYMMYGMNFIDLVYLKKENIQSGRVIYRRRKTGRMYNIKITEALQVLLSYYQSDSEYLFPIIKSDTPLSQSKEIQWARKRFNAKLKLLAEECGIPEKLTSYVSRHTFATQAMLSEVPLNAISAMLGHSSLRVTEIYIQKLKVDVLDGYNERVLSKVI